MTKTTLAQRAFLDRYMGEEPAIDSVIATMPEYLRALSYYNEHYNRRDAIEFLISYMGESALAFKDVSKAGTTLGWVARMLSRNITLPTNASDWLLAKVRDLPNKVDTAQVFVSTKEAESTTVIAEIESLIDQNISGEEILQKIVRMNPNKATYTRIANFYDPILSELQDINKDDSLKEGYKGVPRKQIANDILRLETIISYCKMGSRRTRKVKVKAAKKATRKVTCVVILNTNNNDVKVISSPNLSLVGKKYLDFTASYAKRVKNLNSIEASLSTVTSYSEAREILRKAEGKEFEAITAVVNKYCKVIKEL